MNKWVKGCNGTLLTYSNNADLIRQLRATKQRWCDYAKCSPPALSIKQIQRLLQQLDLRLEDGWNIQRSLEQLATLNLDKSEQLAIDMILHMLNSGKSFFDALSVIAPNRLKAYFLQQPRLKNREAFRLTLRNNIAYLEHEVWLQTVLTKISYYPFIVIMGCLLLMVMTQWMNSSDLTSTSAYFALSFLMLGAGYLSLVRHGAMTKWLLRNNLHAALSTNLALIYSQLQSGITFQSSIENLANFPTNKAVYYDLRKTRLLLRLGKPFDHALPKRWFDDRSWYQIQAISATNDLLVAIERAQKYHQQQVVDILERIKRIAPIIGMLVAAIVVANTLITIYQPLLELDKFA